MRIEKNIVIGNPQGLHARPAALLVQIAAKYGVSISLSKDGMVADGSSIMSILMLEAGCGSRIKVVVEGDEAERAMSEIEELLKYGEKEQGN